MFLSPFVRLREPDLVGTRATSSTVMFFLSFILLSLAPSSLCFPSGPSFQARSEAEFSAASEACTPKLQPCPPNTTLLRPASALSPPEAAYVAARRAHVLPTAWATYLNTVLASVPASSSPLPAYVSDILDSTNNSGTSSYTYPTFGIATSGGGWRAAIVGAGVLHALDGRNASAVQAGTGGLLQCASYLAGLSGGSWFVTSLAQADFPTLPELVFGPSITANASGDASTGTQIWGGWLPQFDLALPSSDLATTLVYYVQLIGEVTGKLAAGFPVSVTDVWARVLARHFVNGTTVDNFFDDGVGMLHGAGETFSGVRNTSTFMANMQPFPIVIADSLSPYQNMSTYFPDATNVPLTNPIYEFNPYEMGSYDPTLSAFTPMEYLGSPNDSICVTGFDQASFITAISSNIFNSLNISDLLSNTSLSILAPLLSSLYTSPLTANGTALYPLDTAQVPNPFYGVAPETYIDSNRTVLDLVDGGDDALSTPFTPLLVKAREVDVILGIDVAGDTADNWPGGITLAATQARVAYYPDAYSFPPVPSSMSTYLAQNLTRNPTFFGCNSSAPVPLVVYVANTDPLGQVPLTNTSADQTGYALDQVAGMFSQTFDIATQGIPVEVDGVLQKDPEWPACLACALVDRARSRAGVERSGVCVGCMDRYCWS